MKRKPMDNTVIHEVLREAWSTAIAPRNIDAIWDHWMYHLPTDEHGVPQMPEVIHSAS
jgi:hypothetical protein